MQKNILIVEDEVIVALDLKSKVEAMGYSVVDMVTSGEKAIKKAATLDPDLVLMDIRLSGAMDGITAANIIFENYYIPIIYITAHADKQTVDRVKETQPFGYITKPFLDSDLKTGIEIAFDKYGRERETSDRISLILNSIGDAVMIIDSDGTASYFNAAAEYLLGDEIQNLKGKSYKE
ncbi:MAG: response regulator, partial [Candidatus Heimdallarchaeota archaeon]|nr:response regulator [Candidatus Heimdallarchaeota archaeon]